MRSPGPVIDLTIEIAELEWENSTAQFYGELLPSGSERDSGDSLLNLPSMGGGVPDLPPAAGSSSEPVHAPQIPGTGVLQMTGTRFHLGAGLHMTTLQHAFRARFPYEVKWEPVLHNRLRLATMHFGPRRLQMRFGVT